MSELPNSVDPAKAELWKAMGYPRWDLLPVSDSNVKPSRINWLIWPALVIGVGVVIGIASI